MPTSKLYGSFTTPSVDLGIDTGNPLLNATIDGFLKIGAVSTFFMHLYICTFLLNLCMLSQVGAGKSLAEDAYENIIRKGSLHFTSNLILTSVYLRARVLFVNMNQNHFTIVYAGNISGRSVEKSVSIFHLM